MDRHAIQRAGTHRVNFFLCFWCFRLHDGRFGGDFEPGLFLKEGTGVMASRGGGAFSNPLVKIKVDWVYAREFFIPRAKGAGAENHHIQDNFPGVRPSPQGV